MRILVVVIIMFGAFLAYANEYEMPTEFNNDLTGPYEITTRESFQVLPSKDNFDILITDSNHQYNIYSPSLLELSEYIDLPLKQKNLFLEKRLTYLKLYFKALKAIKYGIGIGIVTKNKAIFLKQKIQKNQMSNRPDTSLNDQRFIFYQNMLNRFDRFMWKRAKIFSSSNEVGLSVSVNAIAIASAGSKIKIGGSLGLGFSLGFNFERKALVFQIFSLNEKYQNSILKAFAVVGAVGKAGPYVVNDQYQIYSEKGTHFMPPLIPTYYTEMPSKINTGFAVGVKFPPPPLSTAVTFTNKVNDKTLLKIEFSSLYKYFIKINTVQVGRLLRFNAISSRTAEVLISDKVQTFETSILRCSALF